MSYKVKDIANKLLVAAEESDELMTNMKLQKMLYYQQGFHLAYFNGAPLFDEDIEAWMYGPVVPIIYSNYKEHGKEGIHGNRENLINFTDPMEDALFEEVLKVYGKYSAIGLMEMTHQEEPWLSTPAGEGNVISKDIMQEFFKKKLA